MSATSPPAPPPLLRRVRRWWADAPFVVQALGIAVLYFAFLSAVSFSAPSGPAGNLVFRIVVSLAAGVLAIAVRRVRARRQPRAPRGVDVSEAAEDGELPEGADRSAWHGALERRRTEVAQESGFVVVGMVVVAVVFLAMSLSVGAGPAAAVLPALLAVWAAWLVATRGRRLARIDALLLPLEQEAAEEAARRAAWAPPAPEDRIPPAAG